MNAHNHNHARCVKTALASATALCEARGVRLTDVRKRVLELVWNSHRAAKTYDILAVLERESTAAKPPTVYRALEFLEEQGLVHKIESLRAYIGCGHPEDRHACHFLICDACEQVSEFCDSAVSAAVKKAAGKAGFAAGRQHVEIHGKCRACGG